MFNIVLIPGQPMEIIEHLEASLKLIVLFLVFILEGISVFCVLIGLLRALKSFPSWSASQNSLNPFLGVRITFGGWLALALEFQLAADILATTVNPSFEDLIRLTIVAIVRTFLNYFLEKEIVEDLELREKLKSES